MGLFDVRCALTGVAMSQGPCSIVLLRSIDKTFVPTSLPVFGYYDGYGSLDRVEHDAVARALHIGVQRLNESGRFSVNKRVAGLPSRFERLEDFLALLSNAGANLACDGAHVLYAIVHGPASRVMMSRESLVGPGLSLDLEPAKTMFADHRNMLRHELAMFARLDVAVTANRAWHPCETGQFDEDEARTMLHDARRIFAGDPELLQVLQDYAESKFDDSAIRGLN